MLSGIANYFFGGSNEETQESNVSTGENTNETSTRSRTESPTRAGCNLKISTTDEEWLLVDKTSRPSSQEGPREGLSARLEGATTYEGLTCRKGHSSSSSPGTVSNNHDVMSQSTSDSNSDVSTLPDNMSTDESWLVTPPPCFTARCTTTQSMEVGSMENLLIEHPSMSVYGPRGRQGSSGVESDRESMSDIDEEESTTTRPRPDHRVQAHRPTRRSGRALSLRDAQSPEKVTAQAAQVAQRKINRHNNRSQLKMQNKLASFRNNSKSYRQHLQQPSSRKQPTPSRH